MKEQEKALRKIPYLPAPQLESTAAEKDCIYSEINTMIYSETQF